MMTNEKNEQPRYLFWIDLETTGLEPEEDLVLEGAWILTEFPYPYRELRRGGFLVGRSTVDVRTLMDPFVLEMHAKSGLLEDLTRHQDKSTSLMDVEAELLELSRDWPVSREEKNQKVVCAGNSVAFDKGFLKTHLSSFYGRVSHRAFDASNLMLTCRSMGMPQLPKPDETKAHRAGFDVQCSLEMTRACVRWLLSLEPIVRVGLMEKAPEGRCSSCWGKSEAVQKSCGSCQGTGDIDA